MDLNEELEDVAKADLLLYQLPTEDYQHSIMDSTQYVEIKIVLQSLGIQTVVTGRNVDVSGSGYQAFDILPAVKLWLSRREETGIVLLEVVISCRTSSTCGERDQYGDEPHPILFDTGNSGSSERAPRLIVTSKNLEIDNGRNRRQAPLSSKTFCSETPFSNICCIEQLKIDFEEDLGLSMISNPTFFYANYCDGECPVAPVSDRQNITTPQVFRFLSQLSVNLGAAVAPCCAGNTFEPLTVMINLPHGGFMLQELQNIIVTGCQCG